MAVSKVERSSWTSSLLPALFRTFGSRSRSQKTKLALALAIVAGGGAYWYQLKNKAAARRSKKSESDVGKRKKVAVDALFFRRLVTILRICVPSYKSREFAYILCLTTLLFSRTVFSVIISEIVGSNAQALVRREWRLLWDGIVRFALITVPAAAVNSTLKYMQAILALRFRQRLSLHVHDEYLRGVNFYKACNLGQTKIDNADQRVTADIDKFSAAFCQLYTSFFKPMLDVVLFTRRLVDINGWQGPLMMYAYFIGSGVLKKYVLPSMGRHTARQSELEGTYRTAHQRIIASAEEIAFFNGADKEKTIINTLFSRLFQHQSYFELIKFAIGCFDGLLVKYWASIVGYAVVAYTFYVRKGKEDLTKDYIRNISYLTALAGAVGQLVMVGNNLMHLTGYTSRVSELLEMVRHLDQSGIEPFEIKDDLSSTSEDEREREGHKVSYELERDWLLEWKERRDKLRSDRAKNYSRQQEKERKGAGGTIKIADKIEFEHVDIVSPEGKLLVKDLNFEVLPGSNVMITGPNGTGKSSLFRILGELWPLHCGTLTKPLDADFLFVPQKPYQVLGTLRDQIIYPHSKERMTSEGVTDEDLEHLLNVVDPARTILNLWGWDEVRDWSNSFSGGQKQRVAMARLFYHKVQFAILDECTSAVSDEVESKIYNTCSLLGITLFTVSHRIKQHRKYHDYQLKFDGKQGYEWIKINHEEDIDGSGSFDLTLAK